MVTWEQELAQLLEKEKMLFDNLENCSRQKTDILANGDVDGLNKMVNKEQPLSLQCQAAETKRFALLKKYGLSDKTLREICQMADSEYKSILETELESLCVITKKLKKRNTLNNELTKSRLEFYGKMRVLLTKPVYGYDGLASQKSHEGMSIIDRKV